MVDKVNWKS